MDYVTRENATAKRLAFVNGEGNAVMRVDNATDTIYMEKRESVGRYVQSLCRFTTLHSLNRCELKVDSGMAQELYG